MSEVDAIELGQRLADYNHWVRSAFPDAGVRGFRLDVGEFGETVLQVLVVLPAPREETWPLAWTNELRTRLREEMLHAGVFPILTLATRAEADRAPAESPRWEPVPA